MVLILLDTKLGETPNVASSLKKYILKIRLLVLQICNKKRDFSTYGFRYWYESREDLKPIQTKPKPNALCNMQLFLVIKSTSLDLT